MKLALTLFLAAGAAHAWNGGYSQFGSPAIYDNYGAYGTYQGSLQERGYGSNTYDSYGAYGTYQGTVQERGYGSGIYDSYGSDGTYRGTFQQR